MNDLIQIIKILELDEVKDLNEYIDTLKFEKNSVFGESSDSTSDKGCRVDENIRSSSGTTLNETHKSTINLHSKINLGLDEYKKRLDFFIDESKKILELSLSELTNEISKLKDNDFKEEDPY